MVGLFYLIGFDIIGVFNYKTYMKKLILIQGLLALVVLSGCSSEVKNDLSYDRLSVEATVIAFCDSDEDNMVSEDELEGCKDKDGYQGIINSLPVVPADNTEEESDDKNVPLADLPQSGGANISDYDMESYDPSNPQETGPSQNGGSGPLEIELYQDWFSPEPIGDVVASTDGMMVIYDNDNKAAEIQAEGEITYATTDGFNYIFADGQWYKVNFANMSGGANMSLEGVEELDPLVEVPTNIPVADMPYKASNVGNVWILAPRWEFTECDNGSECLEIETIEGGILRYDRTERLVEAVLDGILVSFSHLDQEVLIPNAVPMDVPNLGGMTIPDMPAIPEGMGIPADFDMSQFQ